jgi:hypothetical protein
MVQAWQFGRKWEIPAFQNEVMLCLVAEFENNYVNLSAMRDAFGATLCGDVECDKLLRKAFITEFAKGSRTESWCEAEFVKSGLDKCIDFQWDFLRIMCVDPDDDDYDPKEDGARIEDLLLSERIE